MHQAGPEYATVTDRQHIANCLWENEHGADYAALTSIRIILTGARDAIASKKFTTQLGKDEASDLIDLLSQQIDEVDHTQTLMEEAE